MLTTTSRQHKEMEAARAQKTTAVQAGRLKRPLAAHPEVGGHEYPARRGHQGPGKLAARLR